MMNHLLLVRIALAAITIVPFCGGITADAQTYVRVNQIGYEPTAPKIAIALSKDALPEQFTIKEGLNEATLFTGKLTLVSGEWGQFAHHAELNFTSFQTEGRFFIQVGSTR